MLPSCCVAEHRSNRSEAALCHSARAHCWSRELPYCVHIIYTLNVHHSIYCRSLQNLCRTRNRDAAWYFTSVLARLRVTAASWGSTRKNMQPRCACRGGVCLCLAPERGPRRANLSRSPTLLFLLVLVVIYRFRHFSHSFCRSHAFYSQ